MCSSDTTHLDETPHELGYQYTLRIHFARNISAELSLLNTGLGILIHVTSGPADKN